VQAFFPVVEDGGYLVIVGSSGCWVTTSGMWVSPEGDRGGQPVGCDRGSTDHDRSWSSGEHEASPSVRRLSGDSDHGYVKGHRCLGSPPAFGGN
jgi:hypothetical protein